MRTRLLSFVAVAVVTCLTACSDTANQSAPVAEPTASAEANAPGPKIEVSVKNREQLQQLVNSHAGKVVVLDLWAKW
jgi:thiol:disulfide interchange protein